MRSPRGALVNFRVYFYTVRGTVGLSDCAQNGTNKHWSPCMCQRKNAFFGSGYFLTRVNSLSSTLCSTTKVSIHRCTNLMDSSPWVQYCIFVSRLQLHYSILLRDNTVGSLRCIMKLPPINVQKYPPLYSYCISIFLSYSWYLQGGRKALLNIWDLFSISIHINKKLPYARGN